MYAPCGEGDNRLVSVASLDDIFSSKRATGTKKDLADITRLEPFTSEYIRFHKQ